MKKGIRLYTIKDCFASELEEVAQSIIENSTVDLRSIQEMHEILTNENLNRGKHNDISKLDTENFNLILEILALKRPLFNRKDSLFHRLVLMINSDISSLRQKAIKSIQEVVSVDQSLMKSPIIFQPIKGRLLDASIGVRDAAVDLIWKVMSDKFDPEFIKKYYYVLSDRVMV